MNFVYAVAFAAKELFVPVRIVLPWSQAEHKNTQLIHQLGVTIDIVEGTSSQIVEARIADYVGKGYIAIRPYDDISVISGYASIADEILRQLSEFESAKHTTVVLPIGGGALIAGVSARLKRLSPTVRVVGVQSTASDSMLRSLQHGRIVELPDATKYAESVAVKRVSPLTFRLTLPHVDDLVLVDANEIRSEIDFAFGNCGVALEPAGAMALAALNRLSESKQDNDGRAIFLLTGRNLDFPRADVSVSRSNQAQHRFDVFISHASEDKESVVEPLVQALTKVGVRVWYDKSALRIGDSLRRSIDTGLRESRYGVVVLSKAFFSKEWPQKELDALAAKETGGEKVILPVWHDIDFDFIRSRSSLLADRVAANTSVGVKSLALQISQIVGHG